MLLIASKKNKTQILQSEHHRHFLHKIYVLTEHYQQLHRDITKYWRVTEEKKKNRQGLKQKALERIKPFWLQVYTAFGSWQKGLCAALTSFIGNPHSALSVQTFSRLSLPTVPRAPVPEVLNFPFASEMLPSHCPPYRLPSHTLLFLGFYKLICL